MAGIKDSAISKVNKHDLNTENKRVSGDDDLGHVFSRLSVFSERERESIGYPDQRDGFEVNNV